MTLDRVFIPPPEAPVYEPTPDEFQDPIAYIARIRPEAEKFGICKIKPPSHWQPPFAADADTFKFVPRIQKLNELEAKSRIRMHFLDDLAKFWELQNNALKIPLIENKHLDLYHFRKFVHERDGYHKITKENKWHEIASQLGHSSSFEIVNQLKNFYHKVLLPYDVFVANTSARVPHVKLEQRVMKQEVKNEQSATINSSFLPSTPSSSNNVSFEVKREISPKGSLLSHSMNSELKKLQFYGAGPKAVIPTCDDEICQDVPKRTRPKSKGGKLNNSSEMVTCSSCNEIGSMEDMIICSICSGKYHYSCLILPVKETARKRWRCSHCIAKECKRPMPSYGFQQSEIEYSLRSFGEMADKFKSEYFKTPCHLVSCSTVEQEFWRLVNCLEEDVVVEYGADIHTMEAGSGFPTSKSLNLSEEEKIYIDSPWNLNNLPVLPHSLLRYINIEINGMKVPWVYVGMCFSSFAWHIEDHWNYSINYMHWGEPKTWYGVPGTSAEHLEKCMKKNAPELFDEFPDLLHHITTIMNPNLLTKSGVPIFRTDQHAGEFVVTFPRSYHSGFNQGYNFAEAVNFCTGDWLPFGHGCTENYRLLKRQCVFSNDEFVCRIISEVKDLTKECVMDLYQVFQMILKSETETRTKLKLEGITNSERKDFASLPDDERQCCFCNTTCYLSAVDCKCSESKMVCLHHIDDLCKCPSSKKTFKYSFTLEELDEMCSKLASQFQGFESWSQKAKKAMEAKGRCRIKLDTLKSILKEAEEKKYPSCPLIESLRDACKKADRCHYIVQLMSDHQIDEPETIEKPSYEELLRMLDNIDNLPCKVPWKPKLLTILSQVEDFREEIKAVVSKEPLDSDAIDVLFEKCNDLNIDLPDVTLLHQAMSKISWLDEVSLVESETLQLSSDTVLRLYETGQSLPQCSLSAQKLKLLQQLIQDFRNLESTSMAYLTKKPSESLTTIEKLIDQCSHSKVVIPSTVLLETCVKDAKEWISAVEDMFPDQIQLDGTMRMRPYLEDVELLLDRGHQLPVHLPVTSIISAKISKSKSWLSQLSQVLLKSKTFSLLEVLIPRCDISLLLTKNSDRNDLLNKSLDLRRNLKDIDLNQEKERELEEMKRLRRINKTKISSSRKTTHCVCNQGKSGSMIECHLCCELYHLSCVGYNSQIQNLSKEEYDGYLCPRCARTNRLSIPALRACIGRYENDLDVNLHEGDVLKDVVKRADIWRENVKRLFECLNLSSVVNLWECTERGENILNFKVSDLNIPQSSLDILEELLVAGNLMEVSLTEKNLLRFVLCTFMDSYKSSILNYPDVLPDVIKACSTSNMKKKKRSLEFAFKSDKTDPSPASKVAKLHEGSRNDEEDEPCSASICLRPADDAVEWVQCDICQMWFHFVCIGLRRCDLREDEEFQCKSCLAQPPEVIIKECYSLATTRESEKAEIESVSLVNAVPFKNAEADKKPSTKSIFFEGFKDIKVSPTSAGKIKPVSIYLSDIMRSHKSPSVDVLSGAKCVSLTPGYAKPALKKKKVPTVRMLFPKLNSSFSTGLLNNYSSTPGSKPATLLAARFLKPFTHKPSTEPIIQLSTSNVQPSSASALNVQSPTTSALNVQSPTTSALTLQSSTTSNVELLAASDCHHSTAPSDAQSSVLSNTQTSPTSIVESSVVVENNLDIQSSMNLNATSYDEDQLLIINIDSDEENMNESSQVEFPPMNVATSSSEDISDINNSSSYKELPDSCTLPQSTTNEFESTTIPQQLVLRNGVSICQPCPNPLMAIRLRPVSENLIHKSSAPSPDVIIIDDEN